MEDPKDMLVRVLTLIRDLARAKHAGESGEIADRADRLLAEVEDEPDDTQNQKD
jgi:hypothetical protein